MKKYFFLFFLTACAIPQKKDNKDFKKVYEYNINNQDVLFKFDYIYNEDSKVSSIDSVISFNLSSSGLTSSGLTSSGISSS